LVSFGVGQDFFAVGRRYRYVDVWEFAGVNWRPIYSAPQSTLLLLDDEQARAELGAVKGRFFHYGRIYRLWTWTGSAWDLTTQL
jgi:hypothetical protein